MPKTVVRTQPKRVTNADLETKIDKVHEVAMAASLAATQAAAAAAQAAGTASGGITLILSRVDRLEGIVKDTGLNGHTDLLKSFLEQYAATYTRRQAWQTVRGDIGNRLSWLRNPRAWVKALLYAVLGGIGWKIASGLPPIHLP